MSAENGGRRNTLLFRKRLFLVTQRARLQQDLVCFNIFFMLLAPTAVTVPYPEDVQATAPTHGLREDCSHGWARAAA